MKRIIVGMLVGLIAALTFGVSAHAEETTTDGAKFMIADQAQMFSRGETTDIAATFTEMYDESRITFIVETYEQVPTTTASDLKTFSQNRYMDLEPLINADSTGLVYMSFFKAEEAAWVFQSDPIFETIGSDAITDILQDTMSPFVLDGEYADAVIEGSKEFSAEYATMSDSNGYTETTDIRNEELSQEGSFADETEPSVNLMGFIVPFFILVIVIIIISSIYSFITRKASATTQKYSAVKEALADEEFVNEIVNADNPANVIRDYISRNPDLDALSRDGLYDHFMNTPTPEETAEMVDEQEYMNTVADEEFSYEEVQDEIPEQQTHVPESVEEVLPTVQEEPRKKPERKPYQRNSFNTGLDDGDSLLDRWK